MTVLPFDYFSFVLNKIMFVVMFLFFYYFNFYRLQILCYFYMLNLDFFAYLEKSDVLNITSKYRNKMKTNCFA